MVSLSLTPGLGVLPRGATAIAPSTVNLTYAQAANFAGNLRTDAPNNRIYVQANSTSLPSGVWAGLITGTDAYITAYNAFAGPTSSSAGQIEVSINGGAYTAPALVGNVFTLFSGLPQATRLVIIRANTAYGGAVNFPTTGTLLSVTGAPPSATQFTNWKTIGDGNALTAESVALRTNPNGAGWLPTTIQDPSIASVGTNTPSLILRGDPTELAITMQQARYAYVSIDGGAATRYDGGASVNPRLVHITGLSGTKTYRIWAGGPTGTQMNLSVGGVYATGLTSVATTPRLDQIGDSITQGTSATSSGDVDMFRVAPSLGYVGGNYGVAGITIGGYAAIINTMLAGKTVGANDVAVIALGRNDGDATFTGTQQTNYNAIINALLTKGYRRVICRGVLPEGANVWPLINASIAATVTTFADARVKFCDTSGWSGIATADGTHPTDAGYATITTYALAAYPALIA